MSRIIVIIGSIVVFIALIVGVILFSNKREMAEYSVNTEVSSTSNSISDTVIITTLEKSNFVVPEFGGKVFFAFEKLGEDKIDGRATEYIWLYALEYYEKDGRLQKGTGRSLPLALYFENGSPIALNAPRDGSLYRDDIQKIFPEGVLQLPVFVDTAAHDALVERLRVVTDQDAMLHYGPTLRAEMGTSSQPTASTTPADTSISTTTP
jgi:hypothetical protein